MIFLRYIVFLLIISSPVYTQIVTDRPSESTSIYIVPEQAIQFESGVQYQSEFSQLEHFDSNGRPLDPPNDFTYLNLPQLLARFGINENLELRVMFNFQSKTFPTYVYNDASLGVGFKYRLINDDISTGVIVSFHQLGIESRKIFRGPRNFNINVPVDIILPNNFNITSNTSLNYLQLIGWSRQALTQILLLGKSFGSHNVFIEYSFEYFDLDLLGSSTGFPNEPDAEIKQLVNAGYQKVWNNYAVDFRAGFYTMMDSNVEGSFFNLGFSYLIER